MSYTQTLICKSDAHSKKIKAFLTETIGDSYSYISNKKVPECYAPKCVTGISNIQVHYTSLSPIQHRFLWRVFSLYAKKFKTNWYYDSERIKKKDYVIKEIDPPSPDSGYFFKLVHMLVYTKEMKIYNKYLVNFETLLNTLKDKTK